MGYIGVRTHLLTIYQLPWTSKYICPKETTAQSPSRSPSPQKVTSHRQWRTPQLRLVLLVLSSAFKGGLQRQTHMHDFTILLRKPHMLEDVLWLLLIKYAWRFEEPTDTRSATKKEVFKNLDGKILNVGVVPTTDLQGCQLLEIRRQIYHTRVGPHEL